MFVGRERELASLEELYRSDAFQFPVVYGRRRVGKTRLLRQFTEGKPDVVFFTAREALAVGNLDLLSRELAKTPDNPRPASYPVFRSFNEAFEEVFSRSEGRRLIFVIDEYPYLAQSDPGVSSALQALIDAHQETSGLFLVLCGSSMSFMEHQVLGKQSPLYGRRTAQLRIEPFAFADAAKMLPAASPEKAIELYSIAGGIPLYLAQLDSGKSVEWNIAEKVFRQDAVLYEEPRSYLQQETRSPGTYNSIVTAIATGSVRPSEIADVTRLASSSVSRYLDALIELKVVERDTPVAMRTKKQVVYRVVDNLFRFWFRFVPRYVGAIESGMGAAVAKRIMKDEFPTFMGPAFEAVSRQWLMGRAARGELELLPKAVGSWWGTDPRTKRQEEIDVVVEGTDGELVLGECKWKNAPVDVDVLDRLIGRSGVFATASKSYFLFSKSGFTQACETKAARLGTVGLVTPEMMV